jgi:DNA-binding transcriptional MerR regulator
VVERPQLPDKNFFSMGEACRIAQVPAYTLRYWESHFGDLKPARRSGGHRRYTREDLEKIFQIKDLVQGRKMTVEGARRAMSRRAEAPKTGRLDADAVKLLREIKKELDLIVAELSHPR